MASRKKSYFGIYRGTVVNNTDPMQMGRVEVNVPGVPGLLPSTWALPCAPMAGKHMGVFMLPQTGADVWVQFEGGDVDSPVWVGAWWSNSGDVPALAIAGEPGDPPIVLQTALRNAVMLSDLPGPNGGIMLTSAGGATIVVNDAGIFIENGQGARIELVGPAVTINAGALVVV